MEEKLDLTKLSLNDLMADLSAEEPSQPHVVDRWLSSVGIYPGTMRVSATDLYAEFTEWVATQPGITDKIPKIRQWGLEMTRRLKSGRNKHGNLYYISRSQEPKIPPDLGNRE